jgi:hypothetical protein
MEEFNALGLGWINWQPRPTELYSGHAAAVEFRSSLFLDLALPVRSNIVSSRAVRAIAKFIFPPPPFEPHIPDLGPLALFEITEEDLVVNDAVVTDVFLSLLLPMEDEMPVIPNLPIADDVRNIIGSLQIFGFLTPLDIRAFSGLDPIERRVDFAAFASARSLVPHDLPLRPNACTETLSSAILCFLYPIAEVSFSLRDLAPLALLEAPEDVVEPIDSTVDRLMALIIANDIVPGLPVGADFDGVAAGALSGLFDIDDALEKVAARPIDALAHHRPKGVPASLSPAELVGVILETQIFPTVVFSAADIEDLLIFQRPPRLAGDELDHPRVAALLSPYKKRRPALLR